MPFGCKSKADCLREQALITFQLVLQTVVILASAWAAMRWKSKGVFIVVLMVPCCIGSGLLYGTSISPLVEYAADTYTS